MPRYRFSWDVVPQPLLHRLARDLELSGDAADALAEVYGKRPREVFVRDAWPTLRDTWLARDTATRREVVAALRERGLGDASLPVKNREQQRAYLQSCRNSRSLRAVVLPAFHALGDDDGRWLCGTSEHLGVQKFIAEVTDEPDADTEQAWADFTHQLAAALAAGAEFTIGLPEIANEHWCLMRPRLVARPLDGDPWVELRGSTPAGLPRELPDHLDEAIQALDWHPVPTAETAGRQREIYMYVLTPRVFRQGGAVVAALVVRTMRDALSIHHPTFLTPDAGWPGAAETAGPGTGADLGDEEGYVAAPGDRVTVYDIASAEQMQALVDAVLADRFAGAVPKDEDGDIPLELDGFTCYVRVLRYGACVTLFSPVLRQVPQSPKNMIELNQLNQRFKVVRFALDDRGTLYATIDLWCWPFVPLLLRQAVEGMEAVISEVDSLQDRLGGQRCAG